MKSNKINGFHQNGHDDGPDFSILQWISKFHIGASSAASAPSRADFGIPQHRWHGK
jgi:hypothetical protein